MMEMARQRGDRIRKIGHTCVEVIRVLEDHSKRTGELLVVLCYACVYQSHNIKGCEILPVLLLILLLLALFSVSHKNIIPNEHIDAIATE